MAGENVTQVIFNDFIIIYMSGDITLCSLLLMISKISVICTAAARVVNHPLLLRGYSRNPLE